MNASAAIADSLLGTHCNLGAMGPGLVARSGDQAGGLATQSVNVLQGVCLPPSWLRAPVSQHDCRVPGALPLQRVERDEPS